MADVNDRVLDGLPTDEQTLTAKVKKQKATSSLATTENRFANPISEVEIQAKTGDAISKSTKYKEKWAVNLLENWRQQRNERVSNTGGIIDVNILHNSFKLEVMSDEELLVSIVCAKFAKPVEANIRFMVRLFNDDKFSFLRDAFDAMMKKVL